MAHSFEHAFAEQRRPEWRYIAYDVLKQMLRSHSRSFLDTLLKEIAEVDAFFQRLNDAEDQDLATFAMLNHLAVKKILQKHSKLYSDSQSNAEFWRRLCESVVFMSKANTLHRHTGHSQAAEIFDDVIEEPDCIENAPTQDIHPFVAPGAGAKIDGLGERMTIMTWNACAISFPLQIHPAKFVLGLILGNWWHDSQSDAPMEIFSAAAEVRFAHQADYIRHSGADLVMLQEVLSTSVLESLMLHLADEFDCTYLPCRPRMPSIMLWTCFLLVMGCVQSLFLQPVLAGWSGNLSWIRWLLLSICMSLNLALRWRHSIPAHFLFGNIAGQLVVLRRKNSRAMDAVAQSFEPFGGDLLPATAKETERPSWLSLFFTLRPRGVLRVAVNGGQMTLLNTHLPHQSDNSKLLSDLGSYASKFAAKSAVLLAGDFNPLPDVCLSQQLQPLVRSGLVSADGLTEQNCTWDLQQCLTRRNSTTPRSMQLDFIFLHQSGISTSTVRDDNTASKTFLADCHDCDLETSLLGSTKALEMTVLSTAIVDREKFFGSSPLSDHYGLLTEIQFLEG